MRALAPSVPLLPSKLGYQSGDTVARDRQRSDTQPWRQWYRSHRWQQLRWSVLTAAAFTCAKCKRVCVAKGEAICDHVVSHRGNAKLFWDRSNLQCLCKPCHDGEKQRDDRQNERIAQECCASNVKLRKNVASRGWGGRSDPQKRPIHQDVGSPGTELEFAL